jgi:hypothetical protein
VYIIPAMVDISFHVVRWVYAGAGELEESMEVVGEVRYCFASSIAFFEFAKSLPVTISLLHPDEIDRSITASRSEGCR